jgi:hypothetical protein
MTDRWISLAPCRRDCVTTARFVGVVHKHDSLSHEKQQNHIHQQATNHTMRSNRIDNISFCSPLEIASSTNIESPYSLLSHRALGSRAGGGVCIVLSIFGSSGGHPWCDFRTGSSLAPPIKMRGSQHSDGTSYI